MAGARPTMSISLGFGSKFFAADAKHRMVIRNIGG